MARNVVKIIVVYIKLTIWDNHCKSVRYQYTDTDTFHSSRQNIPQSYYQQCLLMLMVKYWWKWIQVAHMNQVFSDSIRRQTMSTLMIF